MQRDLNSLHNTRFDLLVIGAGISGAWIALDAAQRGLRTALVDKGDFGAATSAATGRMIHGGIRYLQHLALGRLKASLHERMLLLRGAPHLVHPVPFLIPTSGHLLKGKEALTAAMLVYDFFARKAVPGPPFAEIPTHQRLSVRQAGELEPHLDQTGSTGAVRFYDCQMPFPERLTLAVVQSAHQAGAVVANYTQVVGLHSRDNAVCGATLRDALTGQEFEVRAACTVNAAGPWAGGLACVGKAQEQTPAFIAACGTSSRAPDASIQAREQAKNEAMADRRFSKGIHIITRALTSGNGLALATRHQHAGSWLDRGGRHFFIVPWEGHSLVGTTNAPFSGQPDDKLVTEEDIQGLIADVNSVYPSAGLRREDVLHFYGGLYPDDPQAGGAGYQGGRKDLLHVHGSEQGLAHLVSVTAVKYTTARRLARQAVDAVCGLLGRSPSGCRTQDTVLFGGDIPGLESWLGREEQRLAGVLATEDIHRLVRLYGSRTPAVTAALEQAAPARSASGPASGPELAAAQARHAVRHEMAGTLRDVMLRRTSLGLLGMPDKDILDAVAAVMARELDWDQDRLEQEKDLLCDVYRVAG